MRPITQSVAYLTLYIALFTGALYIYMALVDYAQRVYINF